MPKRKPSMSPNSTNAELTAELRALIVKLQKTLVEAECSDFMAIVAFVDTLYGGFKKMYGEKVANEFMEWFNGLNANPDAMPPEDKKFLNLMAERGYDRPARF